MNRSVVFIEGMMSVLAITPAQAVVRPNYITPTTYQHRVVVPLKNGEPWQKVGELLTSTFDGQVALLPKKDQGFIKQTF